jgi:hypothetical protein
MAYQGTPAFIKNALGVTGGIMDIRHFIMTTPNATSIEMKDDNSFICDLVAFVMCAKPFDLDGMEFTTLEALPIVACDTGGTINDSVTGSARLLQYNDGPGTGGVGLTLSGPLSRRFFANACDARPELDEDYIKVTIDYAGDIQITGGVFQTGGGDFFDPTGRDQTDIDIDVVHVKNVRNSVVEAGAYIADGDEVETEILNPNTPAVVAGNWTVDSTERISVSAAGLHTYLGKEDKVLSVIFKMLIAPFNGTNKEYWTHVRTGGSDLVLMSRDSATADSGNPKKIVMMALIPVSTGSTFEAVIENRTDSVNVTARAVTSVVVGVG